MEARRFVKMIIASNLVLVAITVALSLTLGGHGSLMGASVGGLLGAANIFGIVWLGSKMMSANARRGLYAVLLALKFVVMITLVFFAITKLDMNVVWFVAGLTLSGLAVLGNVTYLALRGLELTL
ncbi:MAG TPA: hypothetical protein PK329_02695 [Myxococcota bacterium]|jgi:hypothetical protein|nr:hypothetical protein [Myxococcota bacterium]HHW97921.1 hypothetical protein [Oligoflexales bacterium]MBP8970925.1 hypothetical protein [Myxococcota bacterium]HOE81865.1 hypothetical protein [Myxococcota bacterium]HON24413.1 hypothetical protein [Myxococcota bacterium]